MMMIDYASRPSHAVGLDLDDLLSLYVSARGDYQSVANSEFQLLLYNWI
jgi:hypothetical protein